MKILYICHPEADYLESFVYLGLRAAGATVVDFPPKMSYRGVTHKYPSPYMPGSYGSGTFWTSMKTWEGQHEGVTGPYEFFPASTDDPYTFEKVVEEFDTFDAVVMSSPRCWVSATMCQLHETGKRLPPAIMLDGEDNTSIRHDYIEAFRPIVYFKRELPEVVSLQYGCKLRALPLASYVWNCAFTPQIIKDKWVTTEKEFDVVCVAGSTNPYRKEVVEAILSLGDRYKMKVGVDSGYRVSAFEHLKLLSRAKIGISIRGWGEDTVRYWEIPSFPTMLLSDKLDLIKPDPFVTNETCDEYDNPVDCVEKIKYWLDNDRWKKVATAGYEHCRKHHTVLERGRAIMKAIQEAS